MSSRFVLCTSCGRHVLAGDPKCPFCDSTVLRRLVIGAAGLALMGCPDKPTKAEPDAAAPAASASVSASASASASGAALPDSGPGDLGALDLGALALSDAGARDPNLRFGSGVYGPALSSSSSGGLASAGIRGDCVLSPPTATVPIAQADRVLASLRPRFRNVYNTGLASDPTMQGTFEFKASVGTDGKVTSVDVKATGLSEQVIAGMKRVLLNATFAEPAKPSILSGKIVCKKPD